MTYRSRLEIEFAKLLESCSQTPFETNSRDLPGTPDIVMRDRRIAIFIHGCYWHSHRSCRRSLIHRQPHARRGKLAEIAARDSQVASDLIRSGWRYVVVWECSIRESSELAIERLWNALDQAQPRILSL